MIRSSFGPNRAGLRRSTASYLRRTRLRARSKTKRIQAQGAWWRAVYCAVDERSKGWCEFPPCRRLADDHHHLLRPRSSRQNHTPNLIVHLCRRHHEQAEQAYQHGRLVIVSLGDERFGWEVVVAENKWVARERRREA